MAYKDLREFLVKLEEEGQLVRVKEEVDPEPNIGAAGRASANLKNGPAIFFEKVRGYKNPVVTNVHGSWANHALMLGMDKNTPVKDQFAELCRRWDKFPVPAKHVDTAPVFQNVVTENINIFEVVSAYRINTYDAGFYLSKACIVSRDVEDPNNYGKQNLGTYRIQIKGKDKVAIQPLPFHDIGIHLSKAEARNQPLEIAICLGCDPITTFMASTPIKYDQSEYDFVGALNDGVPAEITKSPLYKMDIPAGCEICIEGVIEPRYRECEGPFGEFPGSYSGARRQPVVHIKSIAYRDNPIFENLYLGLPWSEIDYLMALNTSVPLFKQLQETFPEVQAVNAMYTHGIGVVVSTGVRFGGFGKAVGMRLLTTPHGMAYNKIIIVVDDFVDPFNLEQVMWAMTTRVDPLKDVSVIQNCPGMPLDPSSNPPGMHNKLIIDATTPKAPEIVSRETELLTPPAGAKVWEATITKLLKEMKH
ncbi:MAG TPA: non-oxidative hydroxyarylic acid decarboxylases subunit C [Anaerolineales bacterium]|jgi:UbiD family decarboxylase